MLLDAKSSSLRGRWYTGAYDEIGVDVVLRRIGSDIHISGTDKARLPAGKTGEVKLYGANFPADLKASEINFGPGIQVTGMTVSPTILTLRLSAASSAPVGYRDATIRGKTAPRVLAVFNTIDYLRVLPEHGMARLGGVTYPKGFQQFEAIAYSIGPDKRQGTADDVELGAVPARWSLEEFNATLNDDDVQFVGAINPDTGFFTPNIEGPNPERSQNGNNYGDVQVVATYEGEGTAKPLTSKSMLIVTVPLYAIWAQRGVTP
jgi:quinohemoprotein amine dehydrogenase